MEVNLQNLSKREVATGGVPCPGIFQGRGVFLELGHFDKQSSTTRKRKTQGKITDFFTWKFNPQMTAIRVFFSKIRTLFSNFRKRAGETSSSLPALVMCLSRKMFSCDFCENFKSTVFTEHLRLKNFALIIFDVTNWLFDKRSFITYRCIISDPSQVCKINIQCSVILRHRTNH